MPAEPNWKRQHAVRRAVWQGLGRVGLTGLHALPAHRSWLHVARLDMPLPGLGRNWHGRRLVQVSDLHLSPFVTAAYLRRQLRHVADLRPDVTVVTGDLVTGGGRFGPRVARLLARLPGRVVCTFGNHDYTVRGRNPTVGERRGRELEHALASAGHDVLRNRALDLGGLVLVGLDDIWTGRLDADAGFAGVGGEGGGPIVCLNHDPRNARELIDFPWRWMLSGHTHGRQLATSALGRRLNRRNRRPFVAGHYKLATGKDLYVNQGLSYGQRAKDWCKPEITVFRLVPEGG